MRGVFVTGTDTEVGKTYQACRLARCLSNRYQVGAYKPAASGITDGIKADHVLLAEAANLQSRFGPDIVSKVCPQTYDLPLAPPVAAKLRGAQVDEKLLLDGAKWWNDNCDFLIVEGVGGLLCPLSHSLRVTDLAKQLAYPLIIVAANRLGVVNHTLMTVELASGEGLKVLGIILNDLAPANAEDVSKQTNRQLLEEWTPGIPVVDHAEDLAELL